MPKRYVHNDTNRLTFVGGVMIPPGQGREVDEQFLPPAELPAADAGADAPPAAGDSPDAERLAANLAELLAQPLRVLVPNLADLSDDTLAALLQMEQAAATPRVTLVGAIGELQLSRARQRAGGDGA